MNEEDTRLARLLSRAKSAVLARDYAVAERLYREYLASKPGDVPALNALGSLYVKSGNDDDALTVFKTVLTIKNDDVTALNESGAIYRRKKEYAKSIDLLQKAVIADESNLQSFYNLGYTYKITGKYESAIKAFERVLDFNPEDVLAFNHIGTIYAVQGDYEKALEFYHRGLMIDPNHPVLHLNMAKCYEAMGRSDSADMEYERTLMIKPLWKDASLDYTDFLIQQNRAEDAKKIISSLRNVKEYGEEISSRLKKIALILPVEKAPENKTQDEIESSKEDSLKASSSSIHVPDIKDEANSSEIPSLDENDENLSGQVFLADEDDTEPPETSFSSVDDIQLTEEADEIEDTEMEEESSLTEEDDDIVLKPYQESPELEMERLTENEIPDDELFTHKLDDEIEADNQTDLDSLVPEEEFDIEDETEEIMPSVGTSGKNYDGRGKNEDDFTSEGINGGGSFIPDGSPSMQDDDVYMEIEEEDVAAGDEKTSAPKIQPSKKAAGQAAVNEADKRNVENDEEVINVEAEPVSSSGKSENKIEKAALTEDVKPAMKENPVSSEKNFADEKIESVSPLKTAESFDAESKTPSIEEIETVKETETEIKQDKTEKSQLGVDNLEGENSLTTSDVTELEEEPLVVGEKPHDNVEEASSGPLLPMHKSLREQGYEEKQALIDPKINDTVNDAIDAVSDKEAAERFKKEILMFQELSSLSQSLPKNERENFNESKNNLQLEYVISKLSGKPGLLKASTELRKLLDIEDDESILDKDMDVNALAFKVFAQSRELIKSLPDKGVAQALDDQVKNLLARIFR